MNEAEWLRDTNQYDRQTYEISKGGYTIACFASSLYYRLSGVTKEKHD